MSQQGMRSFSTEFKETVVLRLEAGERIAAVAEELKIRRKLLYEWRAAYLRLGKSGLNRKRGRKPGGARVAELERKIGKQQMDLDFFREALRLIDARDRSSRATPSTRSSKK